MVSHKLTPGQSINTSPVLTLASLDELQVKFFIDETDLSGVETGNQLSTPSVPTQMPRSKVRSLTLRVLYKWSMALLSVCCGGRSIPSQVTLLSGMSADVEIITGEARGALLLPVQALREIAPGSFAVFLVQADGIIETNACDRGIEGFCHCSDLEWFEGWRCRQHRHS